MYPVNTFPPYFPKIHFNIIFPFILTSEEQTTHSVLQ